MRETTTTKTVIKYLFALCYIVFGAGGLVVYYNNNVALSSFFSSYSAGTTMNGSRKQKNDSTPAIISTTRVTMISSSSSVDDSMKNDTGNIMIDDDNDDNKTTMTIRPSNTVDINTESSIISSSPSLITFLHVGPGKTGTSSLQCTMSTLPLFSDTNSSSAFVYIGKFQTECPPSRYPRNKPFGGMKLMAPYGLVVNQSIKWSNLYQRQIQHYTALQKHVIVSAEEFSAMAIPKKRYNKQHWNLFHDTFWPNRTQVLMTYRHSHELLVSEYYESNIPLKYRHKRLLSFEEYYRINIRQKVGKNTDDNSNNHPLVSFHHLIDTYQSNSYNVTIFNYHNDDNSNSNNHNNNNEKNDLLTRFFCQRRSLHYNNNSTSSGVPLLFPNNLCQQYQWFVHQEKQQQDNNNRDDNIKTTVARVSSKEMTQYNLIAQAAMSTNRRRGGFRDLLPPQAKELFLASRKMDNVISRAIQTFVQQQLIQQQQNTNSNITVHTYLDILPLTCLSDDDLEDTLRHSIINGRRTFGEDGLDEIGLRKSFEKYKTKREFCSVNVQSVLEDPNWIQFLKYDIIQYIEQQQNNTKVA